MGSINIDYLAKDNTTQSPALYSDVYLTLTNDYKVRGNFTKDTTQVTDIKMMYDVDAIRNSLNALFSTYPGQRLLLPEFGINIKKFLFSPISETAAYAIAEIINQGIEKWERRVNVLNLAITPQIDEGRYDIALIFNVPTLKTDANFLGSIIAGEGFSRG